MGIGLGWLQSGLDTLNKGNKVFGFGKQLLDQGLGAFKDAKAAFDEVKNVLKDTSEAVDSGKAALSSAGAGFDALKDGNFSEALDDFKSAGADAGQAVSSAKEAAEAGEAAVEDAEKALDDIKEAFDKPFQSPAPDKPAMPKLPSAFGGKEGGGGGAAKKSNPLFLQLKSPFAKDLNIERFFGEERLSSPFFFTLGLRSDKPSLDFKKIIGKPVTISIGIDAKPRCINGIVTRFALTGVMKDFCTYEAEIRPWFWLLTLTRDSRIFQNKSVPEIIEAVFKEYGFQKHKKALKGSYAKRDYTVQHQESDFDFVSRLMEDEGIFYFFDHTDADHTMVLADDVSAHKPVPGLKQAGFYGVFKTFADDVVTECLLREQVTTNAYTMGDYNFEVPKTTLRSQVKGKSPSLQVYEYPGGFAKKGAGDSKVKKRIEAMEEPAKLLTGQSRVRGFVPGFKFKLAMHPRSEVNGEYVLRAVMHEATVTSYSNRFEALPAKTPFRPPLVTPKPRLGSETATVVGKSGEEIWTDKYGRIKVHFPWDRLGSKDEKASCWVRVSQHWAGKQWGTWILPRIGMEVIVTFIDGDPDRPVVTGAVYNGEEKVPYGLPANQTRSTWKSNSSKGGGGYNEFRFEDKKDKEEIFIQAQKDMNIKVKHDRTTEIIHDETLNVKNERHITVKDGDDVLLVKKGNRTVEIKIGFDELKVKADRHIEVKDNETHENAGIYSMKVAKEYTLKVTGNMTIEVVGKLGLKVTKDIEVNGSANINTKAGQAYKNEAGTTFDNKAGTAFSNVAGTDMTSKAGVGHNVIGTKVTIKASAMGSVNGGGMLTVKGGMVKIN